MIPEFSKIIETLVAVFLTVMTGFVLHRRKMPGPEFWPGAEQVTYHLLLPALLFTSILTAKVDLGRFPGLVLPFISPYLLMGTVLFLFRNHLARDYPAFTSVFQGTIRFNSYVGFSVALSVFGRDGLAMAAMFISVVIPVVNVMTVAVLTGTNRSFGAVNVLRELVRNPLIIACVAALLFKGINLDIPPSLLEFVTILSRASLPLGLMAVGAALAFRRTPDDWVPISFVCVSRLILMPVLMFWVCTLFHVTGLARSVAVLFAALPGSPAAYVLARQMGGDHRLMANLTTVQIVISFLTLPVAMAVEASVGM